MASKTSLKRQGMSLYTSLRYRKRPHGQALLRDPSMAPRYSSFNTDISRHEGQAYRSPDGSRLARCRDDKLRVTKGGSAACGRSRSRATHIGKKRSPLSRARSQHEGVWYLRALGNEHQEVSHQGIRPECVTVKQVLCGNERVLLCGKRVPCLQQ